MRPFDRSCDHAFVFSHAPNTFFCVGKNVFGAWDKTLTLTLQTFPLPSHVLATSPSQKRDGPCGRTDVTTMPSHVLATSPSPAEKRDGPCGRTDVTTTSCLSIVLASNSLEDA